MTTEPDPFADLTLTQLHVLARGWAHRAETAAEDDVALAHATSDAYASELLRRGDRTFAISQARNRLRSGDGERALSLLGELKGQLSDEDPPARPRELVRIAQAAASMAAELGEEVLAASWANQALALSHRASGVHDPNWALDLTATWHDQDARATVLKASHALAARVHGLEDGDGEHLVVQPDMTVGTPALGAIRTSLELAKAPNIPDDERRTYLAEVRAGFADPTTWQKNPVEAARVWRDTFSHSPMVLREGLLEDLAGQANTWRQQEVLRDVYRVALGTADDDVAQRVQALPEIPPTGVSDAAARTFLLETFHDASTAAANEPDRDELGTFADRLAHSVDDLLPDGHEVAMERLQALDGPEADHALLGHAVHAFAAGRLDAAGLEYTVRTVMTRQHPAPLDDLVASIGAQREPARPVAAVGLPGPPAAAWSAAEAIALEQLAMRQQRDLLGGRTSRRGADVVRETKTRAIERWVDAATNLLDPALAARMAESWDTCPEVEPDSERLVGSLRCRESGPAIAGVTRVGTALSRRMREAGHQADAAAVDAAVQAAADAEIARATQRISPDKPGFSQGIDAANAIDRVAAVLRDAANEGDVASASRLARRWSNDVRSLREVARGYEGLAGHVVGPAMETIEGLAKLEDVVDGEALPDEAPPTVLAAAARWASERRILERFPTRPPEVRRDDEVDSFLRSVFGEPDLPAPHPGNQDLDVPQDGSRPRGDELGDLDAPEPERDVDPPGAQTPEPGHLDEGEPPDLGFGDL